MSDKENKQVKCPECGHMQEHPFGRPLIKCDSCGTFIKVKAAGSRGEEQEGPKMQILTTLKCPYCGLVQQNPKGLERVRCSQCTGVIKATALGPVALANSTTRCTHCGKEQINVHGALMMKCGACHEFFRTVPEEDDGKDKAQAAPVVCTHCGHKQENPKCSNFLRCTKCNKYFHTGKSEAKVLVCNVCGSCDVAETGRVGGGEAFRCNSCGYKW